MYNPEAGCDANFPTAEQEDKLWEQAKEERDEALLSCPFGEEPDGFDACMERLRNLRANAPEFDAQLRDWLAGGVARVWEADELEAA